MTRSLLLLPLFAALTGTAQDGALDLDFSADGMQITAPTEYISTAYDAVQLPSGYLLVAGNAQVSSNGGRGVAVVKYVPDGELDASFGNDDGIRFLVTGQGSVQTCRRMAVLDDGKILLAGSSQQVVATQTKVLLVRLHPDGSPDHTFGVAGLAHVALADLWTTVNDMAVQPDGKIVVTGSTSGNELFLARVVPNAGFEGDPLDAEFADGNGYVTLNVGIGTTGHAVLIDEAGNILVFGKAILPSVHFLLARYLPDRTPDEAFGTNGQAMLAPVISNANAVAITRHGDGYILFGKNADELVVCRVNADGTPDADWGDAGAVYLEGGTWSATNSSGKIGLAVQADGKLLIANSRPIAAGGGAILARLNTDGSFDTTFGNEGLVINETAQHFNQVIVQQDHRIVAVGKAVDDGSKFFTARFHSGIITGIADAPTPSIMANLLLNPVLDHCELNIQLEQAERLSASLIDAQGRVVRSLLTNEPFNAGAQRRSVDLGGVAAGAYRIMLSNREGVVASTMLIKQ